MGPPTRSVSVLLLLTALGAGLYAGAVDDPYHFDDHHSIRLNPHLGDLGSVPGFFLDPTAFSAEPERGMYRPLVLASYAVTRALVGAAGWTPALHAGNILLHILVAWLVWLLARSLGGARGNPAAAGVASLLFLLHPLASETVLYISARSESLSALFVLALILLWRADRPRLALVCYVLALGAKSTAIIAPALLWAFDRGGARPSRALRLAALAPFALVAAGYLLLIRPLLLSSVAEQSVRTPLDQLLVQLHAWVYQMRLLITAQPASVLHPVDTSPAALSHLVAALFLLSAFALLLRWRGQVRAVFAVPLSLVVPTLVPLHTVVSEHRLYLALALACALVSRYPLPVPRGGRFWGGVILILAAGLSHARTRAWDSETELWRQALAVAPASARAHEFLGDALRREGRPAQALEMFTRADRLYGGRLELQLSMAGIYLQTKEFGKARELLLSLRRQFPQNPTVLYNLALSWQRDDPRQGVELLRHVVAVRPDWLDAVRELALLLEEGENRAEAAQILETTLKRNPGWLEGWVNLGFVAARQGDFQHARQAWNRALAIDPAQKMARENLEELERVESRLEGGALSPAGAESRGDR